MTERFFCAGCGSKGFKPSVTGIGCTFCDGTEGGNPPKPLPKRPPVTYTVVDGEMRSIGGMIERIKSIELSSLTPFEMGFIEDMHAMYLERSKAVNWMSERQMEIVERIFKKHFASGET